MTKEEVRLVLFDVFLDVQRNLHDKQVDCINTIEAEIKGKHKYNPETGIISEKATKDSKVKGLVAYHNHLSFAESIITCILDSTQQEGIYRDEPS